MERTLLFKRVDQSSIVEGTYGGSYVFLLGRYRQVTGWYFYYVFGRVWKIPRGRITSFIHKLKYLRTKRHKVNVTIGDLITNDDSVVFVYCDQGLIQVKE